MDRQLWCYRYGRLLFQEIINLFETCCESGIFDFLEITMTILKLLNLLEDDLAELA